MDSSEENASFYVLSGEYGEYEDRIETMYGVFSDLETAKSAIDKIPELSDAGYQKYKEFEKLCERMAEREGAPRVRSDFRVWTDDDFKKFHAFSNKKVEIRERIGPAPDFFCKSESYWITKFEVGRIGQGEVVFEVDVE